MNPEIVYFQYATGMCLLLENVGGSEQNQSVIANVQVTTSGLPACTSERERETVQRNKALQGYILTLL